MTWMLALLLNIVAAIILLVAALSHWLPVGPCLVLGLLTLVATLALQAMPVRRVKDLVDLKLPVAVAASWLLLLT